MKTSNIILLSFLVVVFIVPVGIFVTLNKKVAASDFTIMEDTTPTTATPVNMALAPVRIIRIQSAVREILFCNVIQSDSVFTGITMDLRTKTVFMYINRVTH